MGNKLEFREKLSGISTLAEIQGKKITTEEVEQYFEEDHLTQEQIELVYDYLISQKIVVKGYEKQGGTTTESTAIVYTVDEEAYLKEYLHELQFVKREQPGEKKELIKSAIQGDALSKGRLIELYLPEVVKIAKAMYSTEVFLGDLVQEGNVSLMLAIDDITSEETAEKDIRIQIKQGMQMLIEELTVAKRYDEKMVEKVNSLSKNIEKLTEELGRKVAIDELALYLEMSEEEVLDILKLAGEELEEKNEEDD